MNHIQAQELLFHYIAGTLRENRRIKFEKHINDCSLCRKEIVRIEKIQKKLRASVPFQLSDRSFEKTLESVRKEYMAKGFQAKQKGRFYGFVLKPALLLLVLLILTAFILLAPFSTRPGGAFSFSLPVSILQPGEIS